MQRHDPYLTMLTELRAINDLEDDARFKKTLQSTQAYVKKLRNAYKDGQTSERVDYSCPHQRAAYLLAYYPHYIEPLYHALSHHIDVTYTREIAQSEDRKLRASFLGAGPAPEILGLLSFLKENSQIDSCLCHLLDANLWHIGQNLTTYHLAPKYWTGRLRTFPMEFNILDESRNWSDVVKSALVRSKLIVMQNSLNDVLLSQNTFLDNFKSIIELAEPKTLFVIIDLDYPRVHSLMCLIEHMAVAQGCNLITTVSSDIKRYVSQIELPEVIAKELLTGKNGLIPKRQTKCYLSAFQK